MHRLDNRLQLSKLRCSDCQSQYALDKNEPQICCRTSWAQDSGGRTRIIVCFFNIISCCLCISAYPHVNHRWLSEGQIEKQHMWVLRRGLFAQLGVGGADAQLGQIFRRVFASRSAPPELVKQLGIRHVKGLLLHGPPGWSIPFSLCSHDYWMLRVRSDKDPGKQHKDTGCCFGSQLEPAQQL